MKEKLLDINITLRTAREERGWSQKQVAALVGTNTFTVCRWERGLAFPSPHYRQQLCTIFNKCPQELGLMAQRKPQILSDAETEVTLLLQEKVWPATATLRPRSSDSRLIGREELIKQTQKHLRMRKDVALCGLPGIGKTALVLELVSREEIRTQFPDGVLWAKLGQKPDLQKLLSTWGRLLGLTSSEIASFDSVLALGQTLTTLIGDRRFLLILDDVWDLNDALTCKIGGWQCSHLLTTRLPLLAVQFAHEGALKIPPLKPAEALELLMQLTPDILTQERSLTETLVRTVGGLPLALTLIGHYLQAQAFSGHLRRLQAALVRLQTPEARFHLDERYGPADTFLHQATDTSCSLPNALAPSIQFLDEKAQQVLRALALSAPQSDTLSEETVLTVCGTDRASLVEHVDTLLDVGLLESTSEGNYTLHPIIVDYFRFIDINNI